jgi:hypothetical protein
MTRLSATHAHITQIWKAVTAITVDPASVQIVQDDVEALIRERGHAARIWWFCHDVVLLAGLVPAGTKG